MISFDKDGEQNISGLRSHLVAMPGLRGRFHRLSMPSGEGDGVR